MYFKFVVNVYATYMQLYTYEGTATVVLYLNT
jgi:hypothetical protein